MAEGVEEVGADRFCATIVPVGRLRSNIDSTSPRILKYCFKTSGPRDFFNTFGYKRKSGRRRRMSAYPPTGDIRVAPFVACALLHRHPRRPPSARAGWSSRHRAMVRVRIGAECHGWAKRNRPRSYLVRGLCRDWSEQVVFVPKTRQNFLSEYA